MLPEQKAVHCPQHDLTAYRLEKVEEKATINENRITQLSIKIGLLSGLISALSSFLFSKVF